MTLHRFPHSENTIRCMWLSNKQQDKGAYPSWSRAAMLACSRRRRRRRQRTNGRSAELKQCGLKSNTNMTSKQFMIFSSSFKVFWTFTHFEAVSGAQSHQWVVFEMKKRFFTATLNTEDNYQSKKSNEDLNTSEHQKDAHFNSNRESRRFFTCANQHSCRTILLVMNLIREVSDFLGLSVPYGFPFPGDVFQKSIFPI